MPGVGRLIAGTHSYRAIVSRVRGVDDEWREGMLDEATVQARSAKRSSNESDLHEHWPPARRVSKPRLSMTLDIVDGLPAGGRAGGLVPAGNRQHVEVGWNFVARRTRLLVATRICPLAANRSLTMMNAQSGEFEVQLDCGSHVQPA